MDAAAARLADAVERRRERSRSSATTTSTAPPRRRFCTACSRRSGRRRASTSPTASSRATAPIPEAIDNLDRRRRHADRLRRLRLDQLRRAGAREGARRRRDRARPSSGRRGAAAGGRDRQSEPPRRYFRPGAARGCRRDVPHRRGAASRAAAAQFRGPASRSPAVARSRGARHGLRHGSADRAEPRVRRRRALSRFAARSGSGFAR